MATTFSAWKMKGCQIITPTDFPITQELISSTSK